MQIDIVLHQLDEDNNGVLDPDEFCSALSTKMRISQSGSVLNEHPRRIIHELRRAMVDAGVSSLRDVYEKWLKPGATGLCPKRLKGLVTSFMPNISALEIMLLRRVADEDDDGEIAFEEFYLMMTSI